MKSFKLTVWEQRNGYCRLVTHVGVNYNQACIIAAKAVKFVSLTKCDMPSVEEVRGSYLEFSAE